MKTIKVAINGFGRIGRSFYRIAYKNPYIDIVCVNDIADVKTLAHLLKYDSIHGIFADPIEVGSNYLKVEENKTFFTSISDIKSLNWSTRAVDVVIESTGLFKTNNQLQYHLKNGAKKVILTAPPTDEVIKMLVLGVNDNNFDFSNTIISLASCTTNNAAPMLKVIHEAFGVEKAYISTIHSYTSDQSLHDKPHKDLRRARSATQSIIPTTTGAAKALTKVFPDLAAVIGGCGIRVPVPNGSLTDMTLVVQKDTTVTQVNNRFKDYIANQRYSKILKYLDEPIVSKDISSSPYSCLFDAGMTSVIGKNLIKLIGWYDNEIGYSNRIKDVLTENKFILTN